MRTRRAHGPASLAPVAWPGGLGAATFALAFGIGLRQAARSNRPHELTAAPLVAALLALALGLAVFALRRLGATRRDGAPWTMRHGILAGALLILASVSLYGFVLAADTTVQVLRAD